MGVWLQTPTQPTGLSLMLRLYFSDLNYLRENLPASSGDTTRSNANSDFGIDILISFCTSCFIASHTGIEKVMNNLFYLGWFYMPICFAVNLNYRCECAT